LEILGTNSTTDWLNICCVEGLTGWVAAKYVSVGSPSGQLIVPVERVIAYDTKVQGDLQSRDEWLATANADGYTLITVQSRTAAPYLQIYDSAGNHLMFGFPQVSSSRRVSALGTVSAAKPFYIEVSSASEQVEGSYTLTLEGVDWAQPCVSIDLFTYGLYKQLLDPKTILSALILHGVPAAVERMFAILEGIDTGLTVYQAVEGEPPWNADTLNLSLWHSSLTDKWFAELRYSDNGIDLETVLYPLPNGPENSELQGLCLYT
jgi:hypothetical protein